MTQTEEGIHLEPGMMRTGAPTTVYMLRHGEPHPDFQGRFYGDLDVPLSERGMRQSQDLAERLSAIPFGAIYSSDLERASYLADRLAEPRELPVRRVETFRERRLGIFQGMTPEEMKALDAEEFARWYPNRAVHRVQGGESFADLQGRIVPALKELVFNFPGARIALACHAGPIRVALADVLGMPVANCLSFALDYACVNVIEFPAEGEPRVKLVNG